MTATAELQRAAGPPLPLNRDTKAAAPEWVMIARTGAWMGHPAAPELIDEPRLESALDYFRRHYAAHGADLVIDYHHASIGAARRGSPAPAAGWVQQMELREEGSQLWGRVLWTSEAAAAIGRRQFRYLSPVLRFNAPDRVSGRPVPMLVHSLALTNTPFLTELQSLNSDEELPQAVRGEGGPGHDARALPTSTEGAATMSLLESIAGALESPPEQVAARLGLSLEEPADDRRVAESVLACAERARELEKAPPRLPAYVCNAVGLEPDADETAVRAALIRLRTPSGDLAAVKERLGLPPEATETEVLNSIDRLREQHRADRAARLVEEAVEAGKVPPAHRDFYLREARSDLEAARQVINSLPALTRSPAPTDARPPRALDAGQRAVCRQLGIEREAFAEAEEQIRRTAAT